MANIKKRICDKRYQQIGTISSISNTAFKKLQRYLNYKKKKFDIEGRLYGLKALKRLSSAQKKEVRQYYKELTGQKVTTYSHDYFYSRSGIYSKMYVPMDLYYYDLEPKANDRRFALAYGDKSITDVLFPNEKQPHVYLKNVNGYFYYEGEGIRREDVESVCSNLGDVIIKPTLKTHGVGIRLISLKDGIDSRTGESLGHILEAYKQDYMIEEKIRQHPGMAALNPSSVNTLRILTYRSDMEVLLIYSVIRIGRSGQVVDNQSAGGISAAIDSEGRLAKYAAGGTKEGVLNNVEKTDTGVILDGYQIPSYDKAVEMVKRIHVKLPYFKLIGWDIAIDEVGDPVLIEFNTQAGLSQSAFGAGFGEYTERIIKELWPRYNSLQYSKS